MRAALVGAFATAALQVGLGLVPLGGALRLPQPTLASPGRGGCGVRARAPGRARPRARCAERSPGHNLARSAAALGNRGRSATVVAAAASWPTRIVIVPAEPTWAERAALEARRAAGRYWREALALAWALLAGAALIRLVVAARRLSPPPAGPHDARVLSARAGGRGSGRGSRPAAAGTRSAARRGCRFRSPRVSSVPRSASRPAPSSSWAPRSRSPCARTSSRTWRGTTPRGYSPRGSSSRSPRCSRSMRGPGAGCRTSPSASADDLAVSVSARPLGLARSLVDVASWTLDDPALHPRRGRGRAQRAQPPRSSRGETHGSRSPPRASPPPAAARGRHRHPRNRPRLAGRLRERERLAGAARAADAGGAGRSSCPGVRPAPAAAPAPAPHRPRRPHPRRPRHRRRVATASRYGRPRRASRS